MPSARKWRTKEPLDDPSLYPLEKPRVLKQAVEMVINAGRRSAEDLRAELALEPRVIEALCNLEEGVLSSDEPILLEATLK